MENENIFDEIMQEEKPVARKGRPKAKENVDDGIDYAEKVKQLEQDNADLKKQLQALMSAIMANGTRVEPKAEEPKTVKVGCRAFSGACLRNKDESIIYYFSAGEERDVDVEDLKMIFKDGAILKNRALFEKGIFYFVDNDQYSKWGISQKVDLSLDAIKAIVTEPDVDVMIRKVKELTKDKTDTNVTHSFKFIIAQMMVDNEKEPLRSWRYENRVALENYLGNKFDELIANVGLYNIVRQMRP